MCCSEGVGPSGSLRDQWRAYQTPTWAIILGIIGLFIFLIGLVFFFVKENQQVESRISTVTLTDGRSFSGPYVDNASYK